MTTPRNSISNTTVRWSDRQGNRDRKARLLVVPISGKPYWFGGGGTPEIKVVGNSYKKDGKWSNHTWDLEVRCAYALPVLQGWETGKWREGLCESLGIPPTAGWDVISEQLGVRESDLIGGGKVIVPFGPTPVEQETD